VLVSLTTWKAVSKTINRNLPTGQRRRNVRDQARGAPDRPEVAEGPSCYRGIHPDRVGTFPFQCSVFCAMVTCSPIAQRQASVVVLRQKMGRGLAHPHEGRNRQPSFRGRNHPGFSNPYIAYRIDFTFFTSIPAWFVGRNEIACGLSEIAEPRDEFRLSR